MSTVARFEIPYTRFLDENGRVVGEPLPEFAREPANLVPVYRLMVLTRTLDQRAVSLQRTGKMGTYASALGQEAVGAAAGSAMRPEDVLVPTYREQAAQLARGVTLTEILSYWGGFESGSDFQGPRHDFPVSVPIATQVLHAAGAAVAFKLRGEKRVAVSICGDGATSKGDFYEAMNVAGAWKLPVVFVVANNQWAISVPRRAQSACETLAQKAVAAGFGGEQVDGNDAIAVRWALERALERARGGGGPTLVEALTYRMHDHTTADDATRYRSDEELSAQWKKDPVARLRTWLGNAGAWSKEDEEQLIAECKAQVQAAADAYLETPLPGPEAMFDFLYETLPDALRAQREAAIAEAGRNV